MKRLAIGIFLLLSGIGIAFAEVKGKTVEYTASGTTLKGYLAYDDSIKGKRPGILVVHEWWGLNDYARRRARMLAGLGFTALALDMYGDGKQANHPDDAGKFSGEVRKNLPLAKARFDAARKLLVKQETVDPKHIAAIGYCFGGSIVLEMARVGEPLNGVVSFHGGLTTDHPARPGKVKAKVLVLTGADDPFAPPEQVEGFAKEMKAAGADFRVIVYPGAKHSFTNPGADAFGKKFNLPLAYNAAADKKSWKEMQAFFKRVFKQ